MVVLPIDSVIRSFFEGDLAILSWDVLCPSLIGKPFEAECVQLSSTPDAFLIMNASAVLVSLLHAETHVDAVHVPILIHC